MSENEIEQLIQRKDWAAAQVRIQRELLFNPTDHWSWFTLSLTFYEQVHYPEALACAKRAVELAPDCPLALWHYAGSLYMSDQLSAAAAIWTILLNMEIETIAYGEHGEGMDWALQLVNDVQYRLARYYEFIGEKQMAKQAFHKYLHNRDHGVGSIYDRAKVEKLVAALSSNEQ